MTPERGRQIQTLFDRLVQSDLAERDRILAVAEECAGDPELHAEVQKLLAHHDRAATDGFLPTAWPTTPAPVAGDASSVADGIQHGAPPGFQILQVLGRGGMGIVYKARQPALNRVVALKMILTGDHADAPASERFRREAKAVAALNHANIVRLFEFGEHEGMAFFSMEFVGGGNLAQAIAGTTQPARAAASLVQKLADAMHYAHESGIIHRDLKPANVLLQAENLKSRDVSSPTEGARLNLESAIPKIADFGLAKQLKWGRGFHAKRRDSRDAELHGA
jgi:serine/threonine protein kinase